MDAPYAAVAISIPGLNIDLPGVEAEANGLVEIFKLRGAVRFSLGGGQGFALQNFRVNGFDVFGQGIATLPPPTSAWQAPTADLAKPYADAARLDRRAQRARHDRRPLP